MAQTPNGQSAMLKFIYDNAKIIAISISFFTFGFAIGADVFDLTSEDGINALIAGAVCGMTVLMIEYSKSKKQHSEIVARLSQETDRAVA
jgi:mannose/fructose/N-acetylgalactosamine-specific phosphotransferase system component IID